MRPKVYLINRPSLDWGRIQAFLKEQDLKWMRTEGATEAEELIEFSGRICYMSFGTKQSPRNNAKYIENLVLSGHESVLEHASWSFLLTGVSRALTHQLVRHRVGVAFSQLSQQYHDEAEAEFVMPREISASPEARKIWTAHTAASIAAYKKIRDQLEVEFSVAKLGFNKKEHSRSINSAARSVLSNSTETKIVMTANARAIRHFLKVRGDIVGDSEMRALAAEIFEMVKVEAPSVFFDFELVELKDGSPSVRTRVK